MSEQPKVRNWHAVAAHQRRAATFGGGKRRKARKSRAEARRAIRRGEDQ